METYNGHVRTPQDAIILFEACRIGILPRVQRRLSEKERQSIRSGSVFVWDEREAGMRRWTDGKSWSASRVSGSFLTYREMEGKRGGGTVAPPAKTPDSGRNSGDDGDGEEGPDGYRYKPDGLMKQSFSITTSTNQHLHLISYYSRSHPNAPGLQQPSTDPNFRTIRPAPGLYPESTVNEQHTAPAVTRSPMPATSPYTLPPQPPPPPYPHPNAAHPHGYGYVPPPHHGYPIAPMPGPPNGYSQHQYPNGYGAPPYPPPSGLPGLAGQPYPVPHYPPHPHIPVLQPPPNSLDQRPSRNEESNPSITHPPPPPPSSSRQQQEQQQQQQQIQQQQQHQHQQKQQQPPQQQQQEQQQQQQYQQDAGPSKKSQAPSQFPTSSQPPGSRSPQPPVSPIDPRLMGAAAPASTQINGSSSVISAVAATENKDTRTESPPERRVSPTPFTHLPKSDALLHTPGAEEPAVENGIPPESKSDRPGSMSPGGTTRKVDGPADIPSQKLAFGEDKRALKALDKVFI